MARALIVVMLCVGAVARGDAPVAPVAPVGPVGPATIETYLERGQKLFDAQEYAGVIQTLGPVTRDVRATRAQRLRALELIALAELIDGDQGAARATFERILDIDPGYQLRDPSGSPKVRAFFDELKKQLIPGYDPSAGADLEHAVPTAGIAGRTLEIDVRATRGNVFDLVVATRRRGELGYKITVASPRGGGRWRARITPDASPRPYVLEYYIEARDAGGGSIARVASPDQPLEIALAAGGPVAGSHPWYSRWYVIAGAAAVAAGVTGIAVFETRGPGPGSLPPGSVTVTP